MPKQAGGNRALDTVKPVLLALALLAVALAFLNGLVATFGNSPQFSFTLAGSFAIFLATRPSRSEVVVTLVLGLALRFAYGASVGVKPYFGSVLIAFAGFLGVASLMVLAFAALRNQRFSEFGTAAFFPGSRLSWASFCPSQIIYPPLTFDAHLLATDGTFGFQPSFALGRMISGHPLLWNLTSTVYYALPFAVALALRGATWRARGRSPSSIVVVRIDERAGILPLCSVPGHWAGIRVPRMVSVENARPVRPFAGTAIRTGGAAQCDAFAALQHGPAGLLEHVASAKGRPDCGWTVPGRNRICDSGLGRALPDRYRRGVSILADVSICFCKHRHRECGMEVWRDVEQRRIGRSMAACASDLDSTACGVARGYVRRCDCDAWILDLGAAPIVPARSSVRLTATRLPICSVRHCPIHLYLARNLRLNVTQSKLLD